MIRKLIASTSMILVLLFFGAVFVFAGQSAVRIYPFNDSEGARVFVNGKEKGVCWLS